MLLKPEDRDFIASLYAAHSPRMYRIAYSILRDEQDASDALAETFLRLIRRSGRLPNGLTDEERQKLTALLNIAVRNVSITLYSRRKRRLKQSVDPESLISEPPDLSPGALERLLAAEERASLRAAIERLTPEQRDAISLVYGCDLAGKYAAELLGISHGALRKRLHDAKRALKSILEGETPHE